MLHIFKRGKPNVYALNFLYTEMKSQQEQVENIDDEYIRTDMDDASNQQPI